MSRIKKNQTFLFKRQSFNEKVGWIVEYLLIPLDPDKKWFSTARAMASRLPIDLMEYFEKEWIDEIEKTRGAILASGKGPLGSIWQFYAARWWEFKAHQERIALDGELGLMHEVLESRGLEPKFQESSYQWKIDLISEITRIKQQIRLGEKGLRKTLRKKIRRAKSFGVQV